MTDSGASATLTVTGGGNFAGNITGANTALTVADGGATQTLVLAGNDIYGGLTTINSGDTLVAGSGTALTGDTSVTDNGTLDLDGQSITIGALNGSGTVTNSSMTSATLTVTGGGSFSGTVQDGGGSLSLVVNSGSHVLTLSGNNAYSGGTTIEASTLSISSDSNLGTVPIPPTTNITIDAGTLQTTTNTVSLER